MAETGRPADGSSFGELIRKRILDDLYESFERKGPKRDRGTRPEGIVTIVFTDIEDSSALVATLGDDPARKLILGHDTMLRETVKAHDGVEVERAGDGFLIAFSTASRAVEFAIALQRRLAEDVERSGSPVRVRVGMETGEVIADHQGYFGGTVFRAARISELARGGQILVSQATALVAGPERFPFIDQGQQDLRGFGPARLLDVDWHSGHGAADGSA